MPLKIDEVYCFIAEDEEGEGIPAWQMGNTMMPLVSADIVRVKQLIPIALEIQRMTGRSIRLVRFTNLEELNMKDFLS